MPYEGESVAASISRASNAGLPPFWRYSWRMSGVLAKKLGRKNSGIVEWVSWCMYSVSSHFVFFQV